MRVRFLLKVILTVMVLSLSTVVLAHGSEVHELVRGTVEIFTGVGVKVNGVSLADQGILYQDRTYLPVRAVTEALGAAVDYDAESRTVFVTASTSSNPVDNVVTLAEAGRKLAEIRQATAKYLDINTAIADGFKRSSGMIPDHGYHFINTLNVLSSLDMQKPSGLVYVEDQGQWQLVAVEYTAVFKPSRPLLPDGVWLKHDAACHYADGNELLESNPFSCPREHPRTKSDYLSWHPSAWTYHVWAWFPNPLGLSAGENALLAPYNIPGVEIEHHH